MGNENFFWKIFQTKKNKRNLQILDQNEGLLRGRVMENDKKMAFLNKGEDDEMEIFYYRTSVPKTVFTYLGFILTCGILRLIYHWLPRYYLYSTCINCKLSEADKVLIVELFNGNHLIYHIKLLKVLKYEKDTFKHTKKLNENDGYSIDEPAPLSIHFENGEFQNVETLLTFTLKKITYVYNNKNQEFMKLAGLDTGILCDVFHKYKSQPLSTLESFSRRLVYGSNLIDVKESSILKLLFTEVLTPFYIFQIFSFTLWFSDEYYWYSAAIMILSGWGIYETIVQTRENERNLKSTVHSSDVCTVLRCNHSRQHAALIFEETDSTIISEQVKTEHLVPGDIIEVPSYGCVMHCDAILLTGSAILNESVLTGESVPVTKTSLPNLHGVVYDSKDHARHTLFCGTHVIQTRYFGNEKVLAVVIRTGFSTAKGNLVRSILYPPPVDFRFEKDSYKFVAFLGLVAAIGFFYTIVLKIQRGETLGDLIIQALDLITIVVPPALPAALGIGRVNAQMRLKQKNIYCISPRTINVAGGINCVCFDKTGTLTEDGLDLLCVIPTTDSANFKMPIKNIESMDYDTFLCGLVSCHSLTLIDNEIVGDPLDLKMFESTKWLLEESNIADNNKFDVLVPTVLKPAKNNKFNNESMHNLEIAIVREFPFSSSSQRMGVIIRKLNGDKFEYYCKGSPEMILEFVLKESIPVDFHETLECYAHEGYRVIALAHKKLDLNYRKVQKVQREILEKDLTFLGLVIFENRLKPATTPCIQQLNDANIRVIMVTGDNILTALSVAKNCDIIRSGQSVIMVNSDSSFYPPKLFYNLTNTTDRKILFENTNSLATNSVSIISRYTLESQLQNSDNHEVVIEIDQGRPTSLCNNYRFAITGKVWDIIREHHIELLPRLCTRGAIFGRMSPEHKQQLVQELQSLGYCVAMCGDGANDCGALKAAHAGISLSEAESSIASPFTSKTPNISCVIDLVREGRAALVTSVSIFKYMAIYSLIQFISVIILYTAGSNLSDVQFLYIDLAQITTLAFFLGKTEAYQGKLVKKRPLSSLISLPPILSLSIQVLLVILFQGLAILHLKYEHWYVPLNTTSNDSDENIACVENYTIFTISNFQYIALAIVFSKGYPYRKTMFSNYGFVLSAFFFTIFSTYLAIYPSASIMKFFEIVLPESWQFRLIIVGYAALHFLLSSIIEQIFIDYFIGKLLPSKLHNVYKSKKKYLAIERDLKCDRKWPVLTSDFKSAASPSEPQSSAGLECHAEIVIENERKFDRNHVFNKLFDGGDEGGGGGGGGSVASSNSLFTTPSHVIVSPISQHQLFDTPQRFNLSYLAANSNTNRQNECTARDENHCFSDENLNNFSDGGNNISSETFKSLSNNHSSYDMASSQLSIPDIPLDEI